MIRWGSFKEEAMHLHCKLCDKCGAWAHFHIKSYNTEKIRQKITNYLHHLFPKTTSPSVVQSISRS